MLLTRNLAVKETRGGLHSSGTRLPAFLDALEYEEKKS